MEGRPSNRFLHRLSDHSFALLAAHLKPIILTLGTVLLHPGTEIERVYFPTRGLVSIVVPFSTGETVEAATVGSDGVVGSCAGLGSFQAINQAIVQIAGTAVMMGAREFRSAALEGSDIRQSLYQCEQLLLAQAQQSAACNARHDVDARLARWLLRCRDLLGSEELHLTQEFVGTMLGVRRTTVTATTTAFEDAGLIRHTRGRYFVRDLPGLQARACECYANLKSLEKRILAETS
jgi:CRP-like cAMP-binding protein